MGIKVAGAVALNGVILAVEARQAVEVPLTETALARDAEILFAGRVTAVRAGEKGAGGRLILSLGLDTAAAVPLGAVGTVRTWVVRATWPRDGIARRTILGAAAAEAVLTGNLGTTRVSLIAAPPATARARAVGTTVRRTAQFRLGTGRAIEFAAERFIRLRIGE